MYSKKFFAKSSTTGFVFGILICAGFWTFNFVNGPVVSGADMINPNQPDATEPKQPRLLQGLYIEMQYPERLDLISRLNTDKLALEQYNIGQSTKTQFTMAISVHPLDTGLINDDSSWRVRSLNKADYVANNEQLNNETIGIMTRVDKTEKSLFWVHKGKLLIVSLTTNDTNEDLPAVLASIKQTIKWRS